MSYDPTVIIRPMIPIKLSLSGFLSYREEVEIDFQGFDLACISGANGAGKSSILDAITFALFGQARKRDDSIINTASEMAEIVFSFEYESNIYKVQRAKVRGKSSLLEFHVQGNEGKWKSLTERRMRETDDLIQSTLRLDYETFVNASFFLQGKADQFTQQRPADRKRILSSILGLEKWEEYRSSAGEKRRNLDNQIVSLEGRIMEINSELAEEDERKSRLSDLAAELDRLKILRLGQEKFLSEVRNRSSAVKQQADLVVSLASQLGRRKNDLKELNEKVSKRIAESQLFSNLLERRTDILKSQADRQSLESQNNDLDLLAASFHLEEKKRADPLSKIEAEKARIDTEINNLGEQEKLISSQDLRLNEINTQLPLALEKIEKAQSLLQKKADLTKELAQAQSAFTKIEAEKPHLKTEMNELNEKINQIKKARGATCPTCGQTLTEEHRQSMIELWNSEGKEKGDRYRANGANLKSASEGLKKLESESGQYKSAEKDARAFNQALDQLKLEDDDLSRKALAWQKEGARKLASLREQLEKESFAIKERTNLATLDQELKQLGYEALEHDRIRQKLKESESAKEDFRQLEKAEAALKPLEREISESQDQIKSIANEISELEKSHAEGVTNLEAAQSELPDLAKLEQQVHELLESENIIQQELGAASQRVAVLKEIRKRKIDLESQREEIAQRVSQFQSLERALGKDGVPAMLIEQALPQIEVKANEILERLSGGQMHISFITQQAYKDKKREDLRETLEIQISDNAGIRDYEMFSGGEAFRINFAIRLALSEVLAQRAGAKLQTLVIDEGFGSQDEIGRQRLIEAINIVKEDFAKILVITHIDSLKDAFPTRIEVEKSNLGSFVTIN